jgi:G:T-mismatch repair DNA endonuclease (very short patch repair protein)
LEKGISKLELLVKDTLEKLNVNFKSQFFVTRKSYDFKILGTPFLLEVNGDFWHANPKLYKFDDILNHGVVKKTAKELWEKDAEKKEIAEKYGYKVITFWEKDIRNNEKNLSEWIENQINLKEIKKMSKKFPRIPHLIISPGGTNDDKRMTLEEEEVFLGKRIIITSKMDGSNLCFTKNNVFARSHSCEPTHPSFAMAKQIHSEIKHKINENFSIFSEWCYAKHSIEYKALEHYCNIFAIRDDESEIFNSWEAVKEISMELNIPNVPILFDGIVKNKIELNKLIMSLALAPCYGSEPEGVVVRVADELLVKGNKFINMAKYVRKDHVQTSEHWLSQEIVKNKLK